MADSKTDRTAGLALPLEDASAPNVGDGIEGGFRLLFMDNPQPMWVYDLETLRFLEVNAAAIHHYGYSREQFLSMTIKEIRPTEDVPRLLDDVAQDREDLQDSTDWRHILKDSTVIDVQVISHILPFAGRNAKLVVVKDITERKKAESALRNAERKYRRIFEESMIGIFQSTAEGRFLSVNPSMARILGYESPEDLIARVTDIKTQLYVSPDRREEVLRLLDEHGVVQGFEAEVYRKDRSKMWLSLNIRAVGEPDAIRRYEGTFEDVTERKLLGEQLRQAQKMEAVGQLAGGVAHDFNNSIGVIMGYSELMRMGLPVDSPMRKHAEEISKAGGRAAALTRQLLAFSRKQVIQPVVLDLNAVVADLGKMLQRLIGENIRITLTPQQHLAPIKADPGQLDQILMNLAVNARDAMPRGGRIFIETATVELDEAYAREYVFVKPGRYVMLSFSDTGCGMDKDTQTHIFEPFFTTKAPGKGTGLGLSTIYGIVKQNDGYVRVYSEPDKGTTFKIYFPAAASPGRIATRTQAPATLRRGSETVLLVEDEDAMRQLARECLEASGYSVLAAPNGEAALEIAKQHRGPIELVLTDVIMPGISGRELARALTALRPETKVLYMSGYPNDLIAQHGLLDPDTILVEKPFTFHSLLTKIQRALADPVAVHP